jgi:broad specificity phosphatase PhoE
VKRRSSWDLLLIRHGDSVANSKKILAGRVEPVPLTELGRCQGRALGPVVKEFSPEKIFSSPLLRCRETAELARASLTVDLELDERLIEMDYGSFSGKRLKFLALTPSWKRIQRSPETFTFPRGESFISASERVVAFLNELWNSAPGRYVIVSHGDITRIMINQLLGRNFAAFQELRIAPGSFSKISRGSDGAIALHYLNREIEPSQIESTGYVLGGEAS